MKPASNQCREYGHDSVWEDISPESPQFHREVGPNFVDKHSFLYEESGKGRPKMGSLQSIPLAIEGDIIPQASSLISIEGNFLYAIFHISTFIFFLEQRSYRMPYPQHSTTCNYLDSQNMAVVSSCPAKVSVFQIKWHWEVTSKPETRLSY